MKFKYFRDPMHFAFLKDTESECSICKKVGITFDAESYYGIEEISGICPECLGGGRLIELGIETNDVNKEEVRRAIQDNAKADELIETIIYKTPKLPTWQDVFWPFYEDDFLVFEKIASKHDFGNNSDIFKSCFFLKFDRDTADLDHLWASLPEHAITDLNKGNYPTSVYLFSKGQERFCIFDSN